MVQIMIRAELRTLRAAMVAAPVEPPWAAFEAAMLVWSSEPALDRRAACARAGDANQEDPPGMLAEFDSAAAAQRLVNTAARLLPNARVESGYRGGRHRYEIHRVVAPPEVVSDVRVALADAAATGSGILRSLSLRPAGVRAADGRSHRGVTPAAAVWRAALLAAGPGRGGGDQISVRVGDSECARALAAAATLLGVPIRALRRPGGQLISIAGAAAVDTLIDAVSGRASAATRLGVRIPPSRPAFARRSGSSVSPGVGLAG
jgi:hypothetical protein